MDPQEIAETVQRSPACSPQLRPVVTSNASVAHCRSLTGISRGSASAHSPSHARHRSVPVSIVSSFGTVRERDIMCCLRGWLFHGERPSRARRRPIPAGSGPASAVRKPPVVAMPAVRPGRSRATPLFSPPSLHLKVCQSCYCPPNQVWFSRLLYFLFIFC